MADLPDHIRNIETVITPRKIDKQQIFRKKLKESIDATGYEEFCVAMVGSVDAGKSTTAGVLVTGENDDGKGLARSFVFVHKHEHASGRTSDISFQYMKDVESKRIFTFVDLAGHDYYLKTTMSGITSTKPDLAIICISDKITKMTKDHMLICHALDVPMLFLFTKKDAIHKDERKLVVRAIKGLVESVKKKLFTVTCEADVKNVINAGICGAIYTSNKTGEGIDLIRKVLAVYPKKKRTLQEGFGVENVYWVQGHGIVVSGLFGEDVTKGDILYVGPFTNKQPFVQVKVKSIHNDYRYAVESMSAGVRGCLCITVPDNLKKFLRKGMILSKKMPEHICRQFIAEVRIVHHDATILADKYQAFANIGMVRETVKVLKICDVKESVEVLLNAEPNDKTIPLIRSGNTVKVLFEFLQHPNYVREGEKIIFREGATRGFGEVIKLVKID